MHKKNGQASVLLIIMSSIAIILFAITLNWGRISQIKNVTTVAATTSASSLASNYASYGEMQMRTQLGGAFQKCKHNSIFGALLSLLLVIIIVTFCTPCQAALSQVVPGLGITVGTASIALSAASLVLQVAVVQPGLTRYWNQLQKDAGLSTTETFLSNALQGALQNAVTDPAQVTDYFDSNSNGRHGFNVDRGKSEDTISRYAFYNTEQLRALRSKRGTVDLSVFTSGLTTLLPKISNPAPDVKSKDPRYNPCCQPLTDPESGKSLRPAANICPDRAQVPAICNNGNVWAFGSTYPLSYDPTRPDYTKFDSFLSKLGIDEEARVGGYPNVFTTNPASPNNTGLFKALWDMQDIRHKPSDADIAATAPSALISDAVDSDPKFFAPANMCANTTAPEDGLNWKPGKEAFCRTPDWPYEECDKYNCAGVNNGDDCCTAAESTSGLWPEDLLDDTIDHLKLFYAWGKAVLATDPAVLSTSLETFYDETPNPPQLSGKDWVGPVCDGNNDAVCGNGYSDGADGGALYTLHRRLKTWGETHLRPWLDKDHSSDTAWCVPTNQGGLSTLEQNTIAAGNVWGTLPTVVQCLKWYSDYDSQAGAHYYFKRCQDKIEGIKNSGTLVAKFQTCKTDYDKAIQAQTFDTCQTAVNATLAKAQASDQYRGCLARIDTLKAAGPGYCAGNPTAPPSPDCDSFALTAPSPAKPDIYDGCAVNSEYINWLNQSITYFGQTRAQYCGAPTKPTACTVLANTTGEPSFTNANVCLGNTYVTWLQSKITEYGSNTISQICANGPIASCQNLPASAIVPMPDDCSTPVAYSQWLQDSQASYAGEQTFAQYCATNPNRPPSPECDQATTLPRSVYGNYTGPYDVCTAGVNNKGQYQTWLDNTMAAMTGPGGQQEKFRNRYNYLSPILANVSSATEAVEEFTDDLKTFIDGPAQALVAARTAQNAAQINSIPNSIIYGWRDPDPPVGKGRTEGYWHVVQVSASAPGTLPSIGTKRKGFLGMTRCYFLRNYDGMARVNVVRWDEDHDTASFANKMPIWKVSFRKPGTEDAQNPSIPCTGGANSWNKIGLSANPDTFTQLSSVWGVETSNLTKPLLQGAFMISGEPPLNGAGRACYDHVMFNLLPKGVTTSVCARYGRDNNSGGLGVHFEKCP